MQFFNVNVLVGTLAFFTLIRTGFSPSPPRISASFSIDWRNYAVIHDFFFWWTATRPVWLIDTLGPPQAQLAPSRVCSVPNKRTWSCNRGSKPHHRCTWSCNSGRCSTFFLVSFSVSLRNHPLIHEFFVISNQARVVNRQLDLAIGVLGSATGLLHPATGLFDPASDLFDPAIGLLGPSMIREQTKEMSLNPCSREVFSEVTIKGCIELVSPRQTSIYMWCALQITTQTVLETCYVIFGLWNFTFAHWMRWREIFLKYFRGDFF